MNIREIGKVIRAAREKKGVTLVKMATDLHMSYSTLSLLERGKLENDFGAYKLLRCLEYVGYEVIVKPRKFGYTLEDAQAENFELGIGDPLP